MEKRFVKSKTKEMSKFLSSMGKEEVKRKTEEISNFLSVTQI